MATPAPPPGFQIVPQPPEGFVIDPKESLAIRKPDEEQVTPPQATAPQAAAPTADVNPVADVAKSAGIGVAQGALGLATLPGNLESLGRIGIDKAASLLGFQDPKLSESTFLPTYNDAKSTVEKYTGNFYEPQTTAGEYARTIGEFAPTAFMGPGGAVARATNVVAPAVVSETAGQLTKGTSAEPWARAAGALAGGVVPNAAMRTVTPITNDASRAASVARLEQDGVTGMTAGQRTGNKSLRWFENNAADTPFAGNIGERINNDTGEQFTRAALQYAGINAPRATADVIDNGFTRLGQAFDDLAARNTMRADVQLGRDLRDSVRDYFSIVPQSQRAPIVQNTVQDVMDAVQRTGGTLSGEAYQALRSRLDKARRSTQRSDPQLSGALGNLRQSLDDAMERSITPADQAAWREARNHYRNLLSIETAMGGAGENTALGLISPSQLRTAVKNMGKRQYVRGQDEMGNLARAGEAILKPLPNSGTPARLMAGHAADALTKMAAGVGAGGYVGGLPGAFAGAVAPFAPAIAARTLMSRPVQGYLSNQALEPVIEAYNASRVPAVGKLPQAAMTLQGGIGPRFDENGNLLPGQ